MIRLGQTKQEIGVVYDQIGTPTYALDLSKAIFTAIESATDTNGSFNPDGWHAYAHGTTSHLRYTRFTTSSLRIAHSPQPSLYAARYVRS